MAANSHPHAPVASSAPSWERRLAAALAPLETRQRPAWEAAWEATGSRAQLATLAREVAEIGLSGAGPATATALLKDLLPYPEQSRARAPRKHANLNWHAHVAILCAELAKTSAKKGGAPSWDIASLAAEGGSPYLGGFVRERVAALGRLGADPDASHVLMRAASRKNREEVRSALELPGCPGPGRSWPNSGSALHKACYAGPNDIFCVVARASGPADWAATDPRGRLPADLAHQSGNLGRALAAALLTPFDQAPRDANGRGPLHRLAARLDLRSFDTDPKARAWAESFRLIAAALGPDAFFEPDSGGLTPLDLARAPALRDELLRAHAASSAAAIAPCAAPAPGRTPARPRL